MKTVIITGTSSGIGLELVKIFDSKGFNVISLSRNNLPNSISFSENVNHIKFDITKDSNIKSLVDTLKIEQICKMYGIDLAKLLKELNALK